MFTPYKPTGTSMLNDTLLNTPQPQATSTVQRKSTLESRYSDGSSNETKRRQNESELTEANSSLGTLGHETSGLKYINIEDKEQGLSHGTDAVLEDARYLQRCSDSILPTGKPTDMNKENNVNVQNTTHILPISHSAFSNEHYIVDFDQERNTARISKASTTSVAFEPNEISAHSSLLNKNAAEQLFSDKSCGSISYSSNLAEIREKCNNEEFVSASQLYPHEISMFSSGIFGQKDISVASCGGKKLSIGQYFQHKSNNLRELEEENFTTDLGFNTHIRSRNLEPLVDSTTERSTTTLSAEPEKEYAHVLNPMTDMGKTIISLSTIANTLHDASATTPRRLVDQLLMAQRKKKYPVIEDNAKKETFTVERESVLVTPAINSSKFDEDGIVNHTTKLSLGSRIRDEDIDTKQFSKMLSFASCNMKEAESFINAGRISASDLQLFLQNSVSSADKFNILSYELPKVDINSYNEDSYNDMSKQDVKKKEPRKEKDPIFDDPIGSSFAESANTDMQPNINNDVCISKNTAQLCNCIVGMSCEANIELINKGNKWMSYTLKLNEIRGDTQSIRLSIPEDAISLIPNRNSSTKVKVEVVKMCEPIIVVLDIVISDMISKSKSIINHIICFNPEELKLDVMCGSHREKLDFQYIIENSTKVLPIVFHNKNSVDVPVKLFILHEGPKVFSIDNISNGSARKNKSLDELTHLILERNKEFTVNIRCSLLRLQSASMDCPQRQSQQWKSKLLVHVHYNDAILLAREVPLHAQLGTCKIQVVDTDLPLVVPRQQSKSLNIMNTGNVAMNVSSAVVPVEGYSDVAHNFSVKPDNIFLSPGERGSFLIAYKSQTSDVGAADDERTEQKSLELENENYIRCNTPCNSVSASSPTSPQSVTSSRSGSYDRNSPSSTVSSVANVIPVKTTHPALVWNSVKTGKTEVKELALRNTSNNKIKLQIGIWDDSKSFKFLRDRQTTNTSMVLVLQGTEVRTLEIVFSPYHVGPATGKIVIRNYSRTRESGESQSCKKICLYGYGGYSKVKIWDTYKDLSGKRLLPLGTLSSVTTTLRANIKLQNIGDLRSFAKIKVTPKVISPTMDSSWHASPKELLLDPKEIKQVSIEFRPKKEILLKLQHSKVLHIASIDITCGDEPTRWRIRRLYNKLKESGELVKNNDEGFENIVHPICKAFPGEQLISGLTSIRDSIHNLVDLYTGIHQYEIMLTVESNADETLSDINDTDDDSEMYHSLQSNNSHADELGGASFFASQTMGGAPCSAFQEEDFTVTPSTVILNPPICNEATVIVKSCFKMAQSFEAHFKPDSTYFSVTPTEGILSKKNFPLKIQCSQRIERNMETVLEIYTDNSKQDVFIKVNVKRQ